MIKRIFNIWMINLQFIIISVCLEFQIIRYFINWRSFFIWKRRIWVFFDCFWIFKINKPNFCLFLLLFIFNFLLLFWFYRLLKGIMTDTLLMKHKFWIIFTCPWNEGLIQLKFLLELSFDLLNNEWINIKCFGDKYHLKIFESVEGKLLNPSKTFLIFPTNFLKLSFCDKEYE